MKQTGVRVKKKTRQPQGRVPSARELALNALNLWEAHPEGDRNPLDALAEGVLSSCPGISERERRFFRALVYGVVRHRLLIDFLLDRFLDNPGKIPLKLRNVLRCALFQVVFMDRVPASAAVNEAVKLVRLTGLHWAAGLVNAVLRQAARRHEGLVGLVDQECRRELFDDNSEFISISTSHPLWMVKRWVDRLGEEAALSLCNADNMQAPLTLRVNTLSCTRDAALRLLSKKGINARPCRYSPDGISLSSFHGSPAHIPGFSEGVFQVQDEASQLVSFMLAPVYGMKALDLCAGSGGKTTHLASLSGDGAEIVATDKNRARLGLLEENLERLRIKSVQVVEFEKFLAGTVPASFDRIMLDAPCSGLGVIRRRPDIKWNRYLQDIGRLAGLQRELLGKAAGMCGTGGILVYSVCTVEPEETTAVISDFLDNCPGWELMDAADLMPSGASSLVRDGFLFTSPVEHDTDGFFAAAIKRKN